MTKKREQKEEYFVLKVDGWYLHDAYEVYEDDEDNFDFTDDIKQAYHFYGGSSDAPKYLWNFDKGTAIDTLEEAQAYLGGEIIKVTKRTLITWEEETIG